MYAVFDDLDLSGLYNELGVLLCRQDACARVDILLAHARAGRSGALLVRGDAGIGKSALLRFAHERAGDLLVLRARGIETESEIPFSGLADLFRPVLGRLDRIPSAQADALAGALALRPPVPAARFSVSAATLSLLAAAAEDGGVLVLVDDLQWLDAESAEALLYATRRLGDEGVAVLLAHREGEPARVEAGGLPQLTLDGIDAEAARKLLDQTFARPIAPSAVERLVELTAGNPLALAEIPALLTDAQLAGDEPIPEPLPATAAVERRFRGRADALGPQARRALLAAAADDSGDLNTILAAARALGAEPHDLQEAELAELVAVEAGRLEFRHPLVRSAVYHGATPPERRAAHRALAEALDAPAAADRRAWHLAAATLEPNEDVARALEEAAGHALSRSGYAAAASAFHRAARLTPVREARAFRLLRAADASQLGGGFARASPRRSRARANPPPSW